MQRLNELPVVDEQNKLIGDLNAFEMLIYIASVYYSIYMTGGDVEYTTKDCNC
nr:hypothetical protein [Desulforamulus aquiferis]